jgi:hypothetical protein
VAHVLSDFQYAAIGRVAAQAALLEAMIDEFLTDAVTHDAQVGVIVTKSMAFDRKIDMLEEILEVRVSGSEQWRLLKPLLKQARGFMYERNMYLHGLW